MVSKPKKENKENDKVLRMVDIVPSADDSGEVSDAGSREAGVPEFDLARQIMARHRRQSATRRTAPASRKTTSHKSTSSAVPRPVPILSAHQQIIAEIVARDIKKLCNDRARQ